LLIDRVIATWLHLHHLEMMYATERDSTSATMLFYEKALSYAQQRYFAAIELLGQQRKVVLPPLQINVANEQVNVAANATPAPLG
jgi:hypothetical protein